MAKVLVNVSGGPLESLRSMSDETGIPVSRFIRQAIDDFIASQQPCQLVMSGSIVSGKIFVLTGVR